MTQPATSFAYIETTIAPGMTVTDYRRLRRAQHRKEPLWHRLTHKGSSASRDGCVDVTGAENSD